MLKRAFCLSIISIIIAGCSTQRIIKPLKKNQQQFAFSGGGPLFQFAGTVIPMPLSSVSYAKGLTDSITLYTGLQLTNLVYKNLHLDIGGTYGLLKPKGWTPGITLNAGINVLSDFREYNIKVFPQLDANAYWDYGADYFMYFGITNWVELSKNRAHSEIQGKQILSGLQFGNTFSRNSCKYTLESKWLAPTRNSKDLTINYSTYISGDQPKGAVGIYFSVAKQF